MIRLVDLQPAHEEIGDELRAAIERVLDHGRFVRGPEVEDFEAAFAEYCQADHAVGVGNGTDALFVTLRCLGVGLGDEVVVPANSFIATAEAVSSTGAKPVFCDIEGDTCNISARTVAPMLSSRTRAIVAVHLYGRPAPLDELEDLARRNDLELIQDAAQAHGARYLGEAIAGRGSAVCFSFFPSKNLGALGDAGAIVTRDSRLADRIRAFANHGRRDKFDHEFEGVNSRLDSIQAAALLVKLPRLDPWNDLRRSVARRYETGLVDVPGLVSPPPCSDGTEAVWHLYVVQTPHRDSLRGFLSQRGIETGLHYPRALPFLGAYESLGYRETDLPQAARLQHEVLSLPMYPHLTDEEVEQVIGAVRSWSTEAAVADG